MLRKSVSQKLTAEALGSMLLAATVVGSGIIAVNLAAGNAAIALLANTGATVAALICLIALFAPISGAHFNPVVSLSLAALGKHSWRDMCLYSAVQIIFCCVGTLLAHAMFGLPLIQVSTHARTGGAQWLAEVVATFGLLLVVQVIDVVKMHPGWSQHGSARPIGLRPPRPSPIQQLRLHDR